MEARTLDNSLMALMIIYLDCYVYGKGYSCQDNPDLSPYPALIERASKAQKAVNKYPELVNEIYTDFFDELSTHSQAINEILSLVKKAK